VRGRWRRDETGELPISLDRGASDEYTPLPLSAVVQEARRRAWATAADNARRVGLSRRDFLRTSMGAATVLLALNACSREEAVERGTQPGGRFTVPTDAGVDEDAAQSALSSDDVPVIDAQTHFLEYDGNPTAGAFTGGGFPQARCGADDPRDCFGIDTFTDLMFRQSETAAVVVSAVPAPDPHTGGLSIEMMERARQKIRETVGPDRALIHGLLAPTTGPLPAVFDDMESIVRTFDVDGWKAYTGSGGWRLDDARRGAPQVGLASIEKAVELGVPRICVHKGISGNDPFASPEDIGPVARHFPNVNFGVYHSGWEPGETEGPWTPQTAGRGTNRLVTSLERAGVGPGRNVYAELGSTWFNLMRSPDQAAHVLGKLLRAVGEDRIMWGSDSIWYGSPQGQIDAFRTFEISAEFQERFGYPALTPAVKAKVLSANAASFYGLHAARIGRRPRPG
jgi:uncharacterized protein